jgi:hypothetical protein
MLPSGSTARSGRRTPLGASAAALLASIVAGLLATSPAPADTAPALPDLEQVPPYSVFAYAITRHGRMESRLVFGSASQNIGAGRLVVRGHRPSGATALMTADQLVETADPANPQVVPGIGVMRYTRSPDHTHWHLLDFMRYELRRASDFGRVGRDRKTGFCLGDRYTAGVFGRGGGRPVVTADPSLDFDHDCGLGRPGLLDVKVGITPGNGDDYRPALEGQWIDITNVRSGRYLLVHRSNPQGRIRESGYANDVASALLLITTDPRHRRGPRVTTLRSCWHTARCR